MAEPVKSERQLVAIAPEFYVANVARAAAYYRDVLGFDYDMIWGEPPCFCMPTRDEMTVMLKEVPDKSRVRPNGKDGEWDAYIWVRDADLLFAEFTGKGANVVYEPCDQEYYGNREFAIRDLDGYVLAFGHNIAAKKKRDAG